MRKVIVLLVLYATLLNISVAQLKEQIPTIGFMTPKRDIVCYGKAEDQFVVIDAPEVYKKWTASKGAKKSGATFEVTYVNFPPDGVAQAAFQKAVDIWSTLIESDVPIRITAQWVQIGGSTSGVLGSASPGTYIRDFDGAQQRATWYPVALAEKMSGKEINGADSPDIFAQFNSGYQNWSFSTTGQPLTGKTDLVTVVLHEIGHGLGITKSYDVSGDNGIISPFFSPLHVLFDHFVETNTEKNLVQTYTPPSVDLKTDLTGDLLFFRSPQLVRVSSTNDNRARIFAPNPFQSGSSIAHLDENTYNGTTHALMTPQIGTAEVLLDPGTVTLRMLADMGWVNTQIIHTRLPNTEDQTSPYVVRAQLKADKMNGYAYNASEVKLNYTTDGTNFIEVPMTATANPNEFQGSIPAAGLGPLKTYGYYISVKDNLNRTLLNPGRYTEDGEQPVNLYYVFESGPDTEAPEIDHTPKPYLLAEDTELNIEAIITDNIGILEASIEYSINDVDQVPIALTLKADSRIIFTATIPLPSLKDGDQIKYRIKVKDSSVAGNVSLAPSATTFYVLNVVSLGATQDNYSNNFNSPTTDFFGDNLFSITTPSGFSNGAIHTSHPYPVGAGTDFSSDFIYQLRFPIRLKATDATLKFDEIVLVEPGETGSTFGSDEFYDYVVVEGSKDGGITWLPLADGYDSRANSEWLARYNSSSDGANPPNSTGEGTPSLFKPRNIDMLANGNFKAGDEVAIRFRLFTDQLVYGWGWAIDNLKIQIDDVPPVIQHDHYDYILPDNPTLSITSKVSDPSGVSKLFIDYKINNGAVNTEEISVIDNIDQYTLNLTINGLTAGTLVEYRIRCTDILGNEATLPAGTFFKVPAIAFGAPQAQYISDFNSANTDFVGNFFSVTTPSGFTSGAIHTNHPYPNGFGLTNNTSNYIYTLTKPITISTANPYMLFSEIVLVEYSGSGVKDYVVVEGSKDNGATWQSFIDPYASNVNSLWKSAFDAKVNGVPESYRTRLINLTASGKFVAGDNVLIRFRLFADAVNNGWGWSIDNLSIQGPITGIEKPEQLISVYPNPVTEGKVMIELYKTENTSVANVQIMNMQGQLLINESMPLLENVNRKEYQINEWNDGLYLIRIDLGNNQLLTKKIIKTSK